jgi:hypothetical protein
MQGFEIVNLLVIVFPKRMLPEKLHSKKDGESQACRRV